MFRAGSKHNDLVRITWDLDYRNCRWHMRTNFSFVRRELITKAGVPAKKVRLH